MQKIKSYHELSKLTTFSERYNYLRLSAGVGAETFGHNRYLNQDFYTSRDWKDVRNVVIERDNGCDLGIEGYDIHDRILIHHIVPLNVYDFRMRSRLILDPDNLITVTHRTHNAIHYGMDDSFILNKPAERRPGDTLLWEAHHG